MAQIGSNFEKKNWRSKISRDCPLKTSYFLINVSDKVGLNLPKTCNMYIHMYCIGSVKTFHRSQCSSFWSRILTRNKNGSRVTWVNLRSLCAGHWPTFVWTLFYPLDTLHHPPHASTTMTRHFIAGGGGVTVVPPFPQHKTKTISKMLKAPWVQKCWENTIQLGTKSLVPLIKSSQRFMLQRIND